MSTPSLFIIALVVLGYILEISQSLLIPRGNPSREKRCDSKQSTILGGVKPSTPTVLFSQLEEEGAVSANVKEPSVEARALEGIKRLALGEQTRYTVPLKNLLELQGYIIDLETSSNAPVDTSIKGEWELLYTNEDPTRSSPFFSAFRKNFRGRVTPFRFNRLPAELSEAIFAITDNIPIKSVGTVKQYISEDEIKSQVRVILDIAGSSLMTTTSSYKPEEANSDTGNQLYELTVRKTEVLDSTLAKFLPFLDPASSPRGFPTLGALELTNPGSSTVYMTTTYNNGDIRISRYTENSDGVFVYKRVERKV
jgi:hypothetical protein